MNELMNNWYIYVVLTVGVVYGVYVAYKWFKLPKLEQINNFKKWLLLAVIEAETELGSETGQLKLRYVYDLAIDKFKWLSIVPFTQFEKWVDEAIDEMKDLLATNNKIKSIVEG